MSGFIPVYPRVTIGTAGLDPLATKLAKRIGALDRATLAEILARIPRQ